MFFNVHIIFIRILFKNYNIKNYDKTFPIRGKKK